MANSKQSGNAPSKTHSDNPQKQQAGKQNADERSAIQHSPVEQINPGHQGLNPDHLGPAQPRKPGE
jgi:hypothetical protein